jgi:hypothetical protein
MNNSIVSTFKSHDNMLSQDMIDALRASAFIPPGMTWGDYFLSDEEYFVASATEPDGSVVSDGWEIVGEKTDSFQDSLPARMPKWCKHGNACIWQNCPFRHERCEHYDKWVASRGKTRGCRCQQTDPRNCKSPEEGGCKYDHRDLSKLEVYHTTLPCKTEVELWDSFYERGLDIHAGNCYDVTGMTRMNRALLVRSLTASGLVFEDNDRWMEIYAEW